MKKTRGERFNMEKVFILMALMVAIFSYSSAQASPFTLVEGTFEIGGGIYSGSSTSTSEYYEIYHRNSSNPVNETLTYNDPYLFSRSAASYYYVEAYVGTYEAVSDSVASATTTLMFSPDFTGQDSGINFIGEEVGEYWGSTINMELIDLTAGSLITEATYSRANDGPPGWNVQTGWDYWDTSYASPLADGAFTYDDWNPDHIYELVMHTFANGLFVFPGGSIEITGMTFQNVPEPATLLLFGTLMAGLVGTKLRRKKD